MHSRRKILLVHGVAETKGDDPEACIPKLAVDRLKLSSFSVSDISRCHRMSQDASRGPRPILVKFKRTSVRSKM